MDAGIGETMLIGATIGGGMSALKGGGINNIAKGALMGGALGGIGGGIAGLGAGASTADIMSGAAGSGGFTGAGDFAVDSAASYGSAQDAVAQSLGYPDAKTALSNGVNPAVLNSQSAGDLANAPTIPGSPTGGGTTSGTGGGSTPTPTPSSPNVNDPSFMQHPLDWISEHPIKAAAMGLGGYTLANLLSGNLSKPNYLPNYNPITAQQMGLGRGMSSSYAPQTNASYNAAQGGQVPSYSAGGLNVAPGSVATTGVAPTDLTNQTQPSTGITALANQYGINPTQLQQGISTLKGAGLAAGGALGGYSDGGQMLKGGGDGMSDSIPATISGKQPARLADGEFVVPADVVSHLGNGSTDAGAKQLYSMMNKVRRARTGNPKQGKQIKAEKYLPK